MADFLMPSLGADMEAGTLVLWRKKPGERVVRGDIIAEVDTDKGVIEVEVFNGGIVEKLCVEEGAKVPVGTVLAIIREDATPPAPERPAAPSPSAPLPKLPELPPSTPAPLPRPGKVTKSSSPTFPETPAARSLHSTGPEAPPRVHISPSARRLARELGVDTSVLRGTGPAGAITRDDVTRAAGTPKATAPSESNARMRQAIANAMARSNREIPHYYVSHTISVSGVLAWLERKNVDRPLAERLVYAALLLKAVAVALHDFPELNARWESDGLVINPQVNVGMAISLREGGLVIPSIADTDRLPVDEIMQKLRDMVERARRGQLRSSELAGGTITVTSLGERGTENVLGVIYPPQTALVGFGAPLMRPWVLDDVVVARPVMQVTLAADHRASDGHRGARFLSTLEKLLSDPGSL